MGSKATIITLFLAVFAAFFSFCQSESKLAKLESRAFESLESSSPDVVKDAEILLEASKKFPPSKYLVNAYTILGIVNKDKGYYVTSLNHYLNALNAAESIQDTGRISACYNNIGSVYQLQENQQRALEYFLKSLSIEEKLNQPLQKSIRYYNIGEVYKELDSLDLALNYFNNSLLIERKHKNTDGVIYALLGISDIYMRIRRLTDAEISLQEVKGMLKDVYLEENILYHQLKGKLLSVQGLADEALSELKESERLSSSNNFRIHLPEIYSEQIRILIGQQKWQEATLIQQKFIALRDELNAVRIKNQLEDLTFQNELNKKQLEIELIEEERDLARKNEAAVQDIASYTRKIVLFLVFSLAGIVALIIYGIRKITRQNAA